MKESKSVARDPICGKTVDAATALHAERGKMFYFCSEHCMQKFLSTRRRLEGAENARIFSAAHFNF
ncbi:MAG: YHS domain-containing protein [Deltaproteobacteria bacterium]|nr:YHS domain-containing protein [Deltaproteobacteria bacterium]